MTRDVRTWVLAWIEAGKICSSMMAPFGSEAKESSGHKSAPCLACVKGELLTPALKYFWGFEFFLAPDDARPGSRGGSYWRVLRLRWAGVMPLGFES